MNHETIRKYIDENGPLTLTKGDLTITARAHPQHPTDYIFNEATSTNDFFTHLEPTGFTVTHGNHEYEGFYQFPVDVLDELDVMDVTEGYIYELRRLLIPAIEIHTHYGKRPLRVLGLKRTSFRQTQRATVMVQIGEEADIGMDTSTHRRGGYMFADYDETIKYDTIQAWRMRELTRDELIAFDPRWGDLV